MRILIRGGGDLASGAIIRMFRAGWHVLVTELVQPMAVRRAVSFAQAVYDGEIIIEDAHAILVDSMQSIEKALNQDLIPVIVDPQAVICNEFHPDVIIDARMSKRTPIDNDFIVNLLIGIGPGFTAGKDCHAVVESNRGPFLGRVIWDGSAQADTGVPDQVSGFKNERVLRAPGSGIMHCNRSIGDLVKQDEIIATVNGVPVKAPFDGVIRGLLQEGLMVDAGKKIGDVDPRCDQRLCWLVSDKALAVGGGVLEAILSWQTRRAKEN